MPQDAELDSLLGIDRSKKTIAKQKPVEVKQGSSESDPGLLYKTLRLTDKPKEYLERKVLKAVGKEVDPKQPLPFADFLEKLGVPEMGKFKFGGGGVELKKKNLLDPYEKPEAKIAEPIEASGRDAIGLAGDIALDPTTYVSFGASSVAKKVGEKALTNAGKKALKKAAMEASENIGKTLASKGIQKTQEELLEAGLKRASRNFARKELPKKLVDQGGLKFAGKTIIPGKPIAKVAKTAQDVVELLPAVGKPIRRTKEIAGKLVGSRTYGLDEPSKRAIEKFYDKSNLVQDRTVEKVVKALNINGKAVSQDERKIIFETLAKAEDKSKDLLAEKLVERELKTKALKSQGKELSLLERQKLQKLYRAKLDDLSSQIDNPLLDLKDIKNKKKQLSELVKKAKVLDLDRKQFDSILENEIKNLSPELQGAARNIRRVLQQAEKKDVKYGLLKRKIPNYLPRKYLDLDMYKPTGTGGPLVKTLGGRAKQRSIDTLEEAEAFAARRGGKLEKDVAVPVAERLARGEKARAAIDLENQLKAIHGGDLPETIKTHLDKIRKRGISDPEVRDAVRAYDKFLNLWKGSVTSMFPAFHVRNYISNKALSTLGAGASVLKPSAFVRAMQLKKGLTGELKTELGQKISFDTIRKEAKNRGLLKGFYGGDVTESVRKALDEEFYQNAIKEASIPQAASLKTRRFFKSPMHAGYRIGQHIEEMDRLQLFSEFLRKGLSFDEAAKKTKQFLFDYSNLTNFEKDVLKRIFPFYTFKRKSMELFAKEIVRQPRYFNTINDFVTYLQGEGMSPEEMANLPDWIKNKIVIKTGDKQYITGIDLGFDDMFQTLDKPLKVAGEITPPLKMAIAAATGTDPYSGREVSEMNKPNDIPEFILDSKFGKVLIGAYKNTKGQWYSTKPWLLYTLRQLPTSRVARTLANFDSGNIKPGESPWLAFFTAINTTKYDQGFLNWISQKRLEEDLKEKGIGREFKRFYIPKEQRSKVSRETLFKIKRDR